jgi:anaerobic ribonucleoside-triphosphate reductase activating protein
VLRVQGCPIHCPGCYVPETWDADGGKDLSIEDAARTLLDPDFPRDGVTILGGEPFAQPEALARLIDALRTIQPDVHILCYSGYTYESLSRRRDNWTARPGPDRRAHRRPVRPGTRAGRDRGRDPATSGHRHA